jgi:hypothetical protein
MKSKIENGTLIIKLRLEVPRPSSTGKTLLIASTHGVQNLSTEYEGKPVSVVANAFVPCDPSNNGKGKSARKRKYDEGDEEEEDEN